MSTEKQAPDSELEQPQSPELEEQNSAQTAGEQADSESPNADEANASEAGDGEADQADDHAAEPSLEQQLADALAQADDFKDRFLRSEAELENVRKRAEREAQKARKFAVERFAGDLLAVLDSLDMGMQAAKADGATVQSLAEGNELTLKMFIDTLAKHGVETLDPSGDKFDPEEHEAMVMQPSADAEPNTVLETFQKGYKLNDRVLRPARVVVAKAAD